MAEWQSLHVRADPQSWLRTIAQNRWRLLGASAVVLLAAVPLSFLWGFSVDDAWIVSRVADNGNAAGRFSFNRDGPITDAVTPLGFAHFIAMGAALLEQDTFDFARAAGVAAWFICVLFVSLRVALSHPSSISWVTLAWGSFCMVPLHAWAGAGLETPLVSLAMLLGLWATEGSRGRWFGLISLSAACAWRPELLPVALVAVVVSPHHGQLGTSTSGRRVWCQLLWVLSLPALVAGARSISFGSALPLSFAAKSPDFVSGLRYACGGLVLSGLSGFVFLLPATPRLHRARVLLSVHAAAVIFAGGDWMPFFRLYVPLLPWLLDVSAREARGFSWRWLGGAVSGACAAGLLFFGLGTAARSVVEHRLRWVREGRVLIEGAQVVAAVDIGWVGRATSATVVDLAGVTDPAIARLPGGHTSKAVAPGLFAARSVDAWVVRLRSSNSTKNWPRDPLDSTYAVDAALLRGVADMGFRVVGTIEIEGTGGEYAVLRLPP